MTLRVDEFRAWLEGQLPGEIVGEAVQPRSCPIATWIEDVNEQAEAWINDDGGTLFLPGAPHVQRLVIPPWARRFIEAIDRRDGVSMHVTREQALTALDEVTRKRGTPVAPGRWQQAPRMTLG